MSNRYIWLRMVFPWIWYARKTQPPTWSQMPFLFVQTDHQFYNHFPTHSQDGQRSCSNPEKIKQTEQESNPSGKLMQVEPFISFWGLLHVTTNFPPKKLDARRCPGSRALASCGASGDCNGRRTRWTPRRLGMLNCDNFDKMGSSLVN